MGEITHFYGRRCVTLRIFYPDSTRNVIRIKRLTIWWRLHYIMLFCHVVITVCACTFVTCTLIKINQSINQYSASAMIMTTIVHMLSGSSWKSAVGWSADVWVRLWPWLTSPGQSATGQNATNDGICFYFLLMLFQFVALPFSMSQPLVISAYHNRRHTQRPGRGQHDFVSAAQWSTTAKTRESRANSSTTATAFQRICRWGARRAAIYAIILKSIFLRLHNI